MPNTSFKEVIFVIKVTNPVVRNYASWFQGKSLEREDFYLQITTHKAKSFFNFRLGSRELEMVAGEEVKSASIKINCKSIDNIDFMWSSCHGIVLLVSLFKSTVSIFKKNKISSK
jgi:hypothetical protein